jgi:SAM-dependent methyltransferase
MRHVATTDASAAERRVVTWRGTQDDSRARYLAKFDEAEAERWDAMVSMLGRADEDAYLADLARVFAFRPGMAVLDVGAGTGALCTVLVRLSGLAMTALEPAPAMLARLRRRAGLESVVAVQGFCDAQLDRQHFSAAQFDVIASRQLVNGLFDPLTAFENWHHWLKPGGAVVAIEGAYGRDAWTGVWQEEIDVLPLSATQSTATLAYLLEAAGFRVEAVRWMDTVNAMPSTRTARYMVVARK